MSERVETHGVRSAAEMHEALEMFCEMVSQPFTRLGRRRRPTPRHQERIVHGLLANSLEANSEPSEVERCVGKLLASWQ